MTPKVGAPAPLSAEHDLSAFACGNADLDAWLQTTARASEGRSARTYVVAAGNRVAGYYCLATGAVERGHLASAKLRRGSPDPIPVLIIGRLAVDRDFQKQGLGLDLLGDAIRRCLSVSDIVGVRAILIHALDAKGVAFYRGKAEFMPSPIHPLTLMLPMEQARAALR